MEVKLTTADLLDRLRMAQRVQETLICNVALHQTIFEAVRACVTALSSGGRILFCGNGGSAADAQHLAAELSGKFYLNREPLDAEALHVNSSYLTAVANDFSYDEVYARQVKAKARKGDVLFGISTSGNSNNIIKAVEWARDIGVKTIALTGNGGGALSRKADILIVVDSTDTARIQEAHILIGHIICEFIERELFYGN